jgi:hypothetical protein
MAAILRTLGALTLIIACALPASMKPAPALTAELAKKCRSLALKSQPYRRAGTAQGTAQAQRDYYRECIAKEGKMEGADQQPPPDTTAPDAAHH